MNSQSSGGSSNRRSGGEGSAESKRSLLTFPHSLEIYMNVQNAPRDAANAPICIDLGAWGVPYVHYTNVLARRIVPAR